MCRLRNGEVKRSGGWKHLMGLRTLQFDIVDKPFNRLSTDSERSEKKTYQVERERLRVKGLCLAVTRQLGMFSRRDDNAPPPSNSRFHLPPL